MVYKMMMEMMPHKDHLICPKPHRMALEADSHKSDGINHRYVMAGNVEEPNFELLDILLNKNDCEERPSVNTSHPYFCASPPARADNPLVRDAQFMSIGVPMSSANLSQKSSCGTSYGSKPVVRVEGFSSKIQNTHRSFTALA